MIHSFLLLHLLFFLATKDRAQGLGFASQTPYQTFGLCIFSFLFFLNLFYVWEFHTYIKCILGVVRWLRDYEY